MTQGSDEKLLEQQGRLEPVTDRYDIDSDVAAGPLRRVYRGTDPESGDSVEIRVVRLEGASKLDDIHSEQIIQRDHLPGRGDGSDDGEPIGLASSSSAEEVDADLLTELSHPGIGEIRDVWSDDGAVAVISRPVDGNSVADGLEGGEWIGEPEGAAELGHDVANALAYLHGQGVLHLGITPSAIVRDDTGRYRLTEAGVTAFLQQKIGSDALQATPAYLAPERIRDDGEVGPWTDLYSLGVVLYQAMTGDLPFTGPSLGDTLDAHVEREPEPPAALNPKVDLFLSRLVCRLLATDPEERYRSAEELRWDLQMYLEERDGDRREISRRPRIWDPAPSDAPPFFIARPATEPLVGRLVDGPEDDTRAAVVRGEPDSGKTAVLEQQTNRLRDRGVTPVPARASRHPAAISVVEQLARGAFKAIEASDQDEAWREHLRDVSPATRGLAARIDSLGEWIQPGSVTDETVHNRRMREIAGWRDLFEHLLDGPTPFVWIVDDIHEIDAISREIVTEFVCRRTDTASRWLVSRTPGENDAGDEWMEVDIEASDCCVAAVDLSQLTRTAIEEALGGVVQSTDEDREQLFDWLMDRSGGRPKDLQIAFHRLVEADAVQFRAGKPRFVASRLEETELSTTPAAYVESNWQTLDLPEREMATKIALFGDPLPYQLLTELVSHDVDDPHRHLTVLTQRHLAETMTLGDQTWVWSSDDAIREAIVANLDESERPRQHRTVAFGLSDAHERIDETAFHDSWLSVQAACHWVGAGETARAADWFTTAGRARMNEGRVTSALGLLRQAEMRVDDTTELRDGSCCLAELLGDALIAVGEDGEAVEYYELALESPGFGANEHEGRRLRLKLARVFKRRRRFEQSREAVDQYFGEVGLEIPDDDQGLDVQFFWMMVKFTLLQWLEWFGGLEREWIGDEQVEQELAHVDAGRLHSSTLVDDEYSLTPWFRYTLGLRAVSTRDPRLLAVTYASQGVSWCRGENPSAEYARRFRDAAIERLDSVGDARVRSFVGATAAVISHWLGDRDEALEFARAYRPVALDVGLFSDYARLLEVLISLSLNGGHLAAAEQYIGRLGADALAFGGAEVRHVTRLYRARLAFLHGDYTEARRCIDAARSINTRVQDPARAAQIDGIDLELLWHEGSREDAVELARATVDRIDEGLFGDELTETLCLAARLGVRASRAARTGELDARPETLLSFAERCCSIAEERTAAFPTFRALVRCEQGRLAEERGNRETAGDHLDAAVRLADRAGLTRFQELAYQLRSRVHGTDAAFQAIVDARRARMLAAGCGFRADVERIDAHIQSLRESDPDLEPFLRDASLATAEDEPGAAPPELPSNDDTGGTIQLSPDETAVEIVSESDTATVSTREEPDTTRWPLPSSPDVIPEPDESSDELGEAAADGGADQSAETDQQAALQDPSSRMPGEEESDKDLADLSSEVSDEESSTPPPLGNENDEAESDAESSDVSEDLDSEDDGAESDADTDADDGDTGDDASDSETDGETDEDDVSDEAEEASTDDLRETADLTKDKLGLSGSDDAGNEDAESDEDASTDDSDSESDVDASDDEHTSEDDDEDVDENNQTPLPSPSDLSDGLPTDDK